MKKIITGLKTTTTNENNKSISDLGKVWENFFADSYIQKLKNFAKNDKVYTVYTNYTGNFKTGYYDFYLGVETEKELYDYENINLNLEKYETFEFDYKKPEDTLEAWKLIWGNKNLDRSYSFDLEEYDYEKGILKIYIGIK